MGSRDQYAIVCIAGGFIILFCLLSLWDMSLLGAWVEAGRLLCSIVVLFGNGKYCSPLYCDGVVLSSRQQVFYFEKTRVLRIPVGLNDHVYVTGRWWGVWAAGEPVWHFLNPPPYFDAIGVNDAASIALAQSFLHWGF